MRHFIPALLLSLTPACTASDPAHPEEAGKVDWGRDLEAALAASGKSGKPVFALFQEVPGCAGCKQFGREVLSHPLIVEAIEREFTPLLIHNNKPGADAAALQRFGEPAWNFQVVRFLNAAGADILPRRDRVWETGPLAARMGAALAAAKRPVPAWLSLLAAEHSTGLQQAAFTMQCFWTGEMEMGKIPGVITTEAGFLGGAEVTLVSYDPQAITLAGLIAAAEKVRCAEAVHVPAGDLAAAKAALLKVGTLAGYRAAPAGDQQKQLSGTAAAALHLTGAQATKVNAFLRTDPARALTFLTPSQQARLK